MVGDCIPSICPECEAEGHRGLPLFGCPACKRESDELRAKARDEVRRRAGGFCVLFDSHRKR